MKNFLNILKKNRLIKSIYSIFNHISQKKITKFQIIFTAYFFIFSLFLFFSVPSVYDFNKFERQIVEKIDSVYKLKILNISGINYRFIPSPHIILNSVDLKLDDSSEIISNIKQLKISISVLDFYNKKKFNLKEIKINKGNFYLDKKNLNLFRNHFKEKIHGKISINNSNIFYKDSKGEIVSISPIKKLKYYINLNTKQKKLEIIGTIFDSKYNFLWQKDYNNPKLKHIYLSLSNPNINVDNLILENDNKNFEGDLKIKFINNNFIFEYKKIDNKLNFNSSPTNKNFLFNGNINIEPFYFNIKSKISNIDLNFLVDYFLKNLNKHNTFIHPNFSGDLNVNLSKMKNSFFDNGSINFSFREGEILIDKSIFDVKKIGKINFSNGFYELNENNLYYTTSASFKIKNQKEFYRLFSIPRDYRINLSEINFIIEKNLDINKYYISNLQINNQIETKNENQELKQFEFHNIQQLRLILRNYFEEISQG